jgi:hypothetical protein
VPDEPVAVIAPGLRIQDLPRVLPAGDQQVACALAARRSGGPPGK